MWTVEEFFKETSLILKSRKKRGKKTTNRRTSVAGPIQWWRRNHRDARLRRAARLVRAGRLVRVSK